MKFATVISGSLAMLGLTLASVIPHVSRGGLVVARGLGDTGSVHQAVAARSPAPVGLPGHDHTTPRNRRSEDRGLLMARDPKPGFKSFFKKIFKGGGGGGGGGGESATDIIGSIAKSKLGQLENIGNLFGADKKKFGFHPNRLADIAKAQVDQVKSGINLIAGRSI